MFSAIKCFIGVHTLSEGFYIYITPALVEIEKSSNVKKYNESSRSA